MLKHNGPYKIEVDFETVTKLCEMHCTGVEIAGFLEISYDTLDRRVKEQQKPDGTFYSGFAEYYAVKCARGRISLRKLQWDSAKKGNVAMQIFLGKNMLDQTEKQQVDLAGVTEIKVDFVDVDVEAPAADEE